MAFVQCLRTDGTVGNVTNAVCVEWLVAMYPTTPPVPGVWLRVPDDLLPEGVGLAFFNGGDFMDQVIFPSFDDTNENDEIADRIHVPLATPGRCGSVDVLLALQTVLREEQPHAVTELRREVERVGRALAMQRLRNGELLSRERRARARLSEGADNAREFIRNTPRNPANTHVFHALVQAFRIMDGAYEEDDDDADDDDDDAEDEPFRHVFLVGDRVRDLTTFVGLTGTVIQTGEGVTVNFDNPPVNAGVLWQTFTYSADNLEHIQE